MSFYEQVLRYFIDRPFVKPCCYSAFLICVSCLFLRMLVNSLVSLLYLRQLFLYSLGAGFCPFLNIGMMMLLCYSSGVSVSFKILFATVAIVSLQVRDKIWKARPAWCWQIFQELVTSLKAEHPILFIDRLIGLQRKACVLGLGFKDDCRDALISLDILTLPLLYYKVSI